MDELRPKVGIGVMIMKEGKILLGKRKHKDGLGDGQYAGTGGHLEHMESFEDCLRRETREEAGIELDNIRFLCVINLKDYAPKHYVDLGFVADWKSGEPKNIEPEKREGWEWFDLDNLPELFGSLPKYIEAYKTGRNYFDN
ncbi:MAG: hypothetical protein A3D35_03215 [Candidatus Staskawiczbacteria bacterium RIFCSPHIGHO2_02_FULL_34_9]|uniref:Nudix hydrolase domain-containing protein n=1 Tax=Candidatus Staskawiczbacteria bacterium RIFCSPHIGHO2_02_FULL_34_9 TaxID=1802206 RepID=A0A1G2I4M8_9BACT|nr:MAG: hypothetical protein A3D35_03215 [Candidatus Staskawiczbacteria bacterium RIFCSPHIGHO2_02_FULL_34_9]